MDDDEDRDFSKEIVYGFFEQAVSTFVKMDQAMYVSLKLFRAFLDRASFAYNRG